MIRARVTSRIINEMDEMVDNNNFSANASSRNGSLGSAYIVEYVCDGMSSFPFLSPGRPGLWCLRWVVVIHHVRRTSGSMKIMTQEAGPWHLGTLLPWMEWDFQSLPTANGRTVINVSGLLLFQHSSMLGSP